MNEVTYYDAGLVRSEPYERHTLPAPASIAEAKGRLWPVRACRTIRIDIPTTRVVVRDAEGLHEQAAMLLALGENSAVLEVPGVGVWVSPLNAVRFEQNPIHVSPSEDWIERWIFGPKQQPHRPELVRLRQGLHQRVEEGHSHWEVDMYREGYQWMHLRLVEHLDEGMRSAIHVNCPAALTQIRIYGQQKLAERMSLSDTVQRAKWRIKQAEIERCVSTDGDLVAC